MIKKYTNHLAISWSIILLLIVFVPGNQLPRHNYWLDVLNADKVVHVFLFAPFSFLWFLKYHFINHLNIKIKWLIFTVGFVLAISTEIIQFYFINGRNGNVADGIANVFGVILGMLIFNILHKKAIF